MHACLDDLVVALYVTIDDLFGPRQGPGRRPKLSDAELVCLAIAQVLLGVSSERRWLRAVGQRLGHLFPYRLGSGGGVTAVRTGPFSWDDAALSARWAEPLEDQLTRAWELQELPVGERPAGADLLFLQVAACGPAPGGLALAVSNSRRRLEVLGVAPSAHAELAYLPNLRRLAEQAVPLRLLARVRANRPRTVALLAASSPALQLPADWAGRVNLGLDRLTLWVPDIRLPHAAWAYSWTSPPSRFRRATLPPGGKTTCWPGPSGGICCKARCGRWTL